MRYADRVAGISWERIEEVRQRLKEKPALHFIAGEFVPSESGETFPSLDPATNEVLGYAARGGAREVDRAAKAAHEAFPRWSRTKAKERKRYLLRIAELIEKHADELAVMECLDAGQVLRIVRAGGPGSGELRLLCRVRRARHGGPHLPRGPGLALLHRAGPRGPRGHHHPLERPPDALHLAHRPRFGLREHRGPEARGVEPLHRHQAGGDPKGGGPPPRGLQPGPGLW